MKELIRIFEYEGNEVRTVEINGEIWWVLKDVCRVLGIHNHRDVAARLKEKEKGVAKIDTLGGEQHLIIISEAGLYKVIMRSNKPAAEKFTDWVVYDVLPSIRKTGKYAPLESKESEEIKNDINFNLNLYNPVFSCSTEKKKGRRTS